MTTIAIIGASFAGLQAAITLKKSLPDAKIHLFDKEDHFTYIPASHILLTRKAKLKQSQLSLKKYFSDMFVHAEVTAIKDNTVITKKKSYEFDYLIMSCGAQVQYFGNKNLEKFAYGAKSVPDLKVLWKQLPKAKKVVVIGSGLSGVEYVSMLAYDTDKEVVLINSGDLVLPNLAQGGRKYAQGWLQKKGVKIINNAKVVDATKTSVKLNTGESITTDLILQCTGLKQVCPLLEKQDITENLHLEDKKHIFLCGDVVRTKSVPTAHSAMIEGDEVAKQIIARVKGDDAKTPNLHAQTTLAVALGPHNGFLQFGKVWIPGPFVGLMKWWIEQSVLFSFKKRMKLLL